MSKSNAAAPAQARLFVYGSSPELLGEYAQDGTAIQEVVWFEGQPLIVLGPANSNEVFFSYPDHLGAPRILVDRTGAERWRWIAEPFGSTAAEPAPSGLAAVAFPLRFPGQYFDAETGLNYNYFRDYDSTSGRYTQSDPIGLKGGVNTYAYVEGNPLSYADPKGLVKVCSVLTGVCWDTNPPPVNPDFPSTPVPPSLHWPELLPQPLVDWCIEKADKAKNCWALYMNILEKTCVSMKGTKRLACEAAAWGSYVQCLKQN